MLGIYTRSLYQLLSERWLIHLLLIILACVALLSLVIISTKVVFWILGKRSVNKKSKKIPLTITHIFSSDHPLGKTCESIEYKTKIPLEHFSLNDLIFQDFFLNEPFSNFDNSSSDDIIAIDYREKNQKDRSDK